MLNYWCKHCKLTDLNHPFDEGFPDMHVPQSHFRFFLRLHGLTTVICDFEIVFAPSQANNPSIDQNDLDWVTWYCKKKVVMFPVFG